MTNTTTTTNTALVSCQEEMMANFFSRVSAERLAETKKGVFSNSQKELEKLWKALDADFSVNTFNNVLGYNVSEELFNNPLELRRYLKNDGVNTINKIRSFVKNENPNAKNILDWMEGLVIEQASDIARIVEARLK